MENQYSPRGDQFKPVLEVMSREPSSDLHQQTPMFWDKLPELIANGTLEAKLPPEGFLQEPIFKNLVMLRYRRNIDQQLQALEATGFGDTKQQLVDTKAAVDGYSSDLTEQSTQKIQEKLAKIAIQDALNDVTKNFDKHIGAAKDKLTGLWNKSAYDAISEMLEELMNDPDSGVVGVASIMVDIDFFKTINDTYGHLGGDNVLKHLGATMMDPATQAAARVIEDVQTGSLRKTDYAFRYGGEEFVLLLPIKKSEQVQDISDPRFIEAINLRGFNICQAINDKLSVQLPRNGHQEHVQFTISAGIGIASAEQTCQEALSIADENMYASKRNGRARFTTSLSEVIPFAEPNYPTLLSPHWNLPHHAVR